MTQFITKGDYSASVHAEILDAVTRADASIINLCQERALSEMKGYLSKRYDIEKVFAATGTDRNQLVLMMALDIAIYHIFCVHNPQRISDLRKERYKRALEWLRRVRRGDEDIHGLPELAPEERDRNSQYQLRSNPKRTNNI